MNTKSFYKIKVPILFAVILLFNCHSAKADFFFGEPVNLGPVINTSSIDATNCISSDNLELYFGSNRPGGLGDLDIWVSTRQSINEVWEPSYNIGAPVNSPYVEAYPSISSDGLTLYFSDLYSGTPRPGGLGGADIWMTTRSSRNDPWTAPVNLGVPINSSGMDISPTVSGDGLILVFASSRAGTSGPYDLWMSTRATVQDPWGTPVNLGMNVNSSDGELECSMSADGLALFFPSGRPGGFSTYDLWMTTRKGLEAPWSRTINLGPVVNGTSTEGSPGVSSDMRTLYFDSDRPGGFGSYDLWEAQIIPVVDLNGDGIVDAADMCIVVDHWGTDNKLCDIGPAPWGDGIVDVQDLIVLAEHLFEDYRLVAHWTLDEEQGSIAYDSAGQYDADLHRGPIWQPLGGKVAGALEFDGADDYVSTAFVLNPADGSFSVFAWVKGGTPGQVIISQADVEGQSAIESGGTWLGISQSDGGLMTGLMDIFFGPLESELVVADEQWHHVGLIYDYTTMKRHLYVDGTEVAIDDGIVAGVQSTAGLYIGAGQTLNTASFFSGLIDDVRIYNAALTPEQIAALAQ